VDGPGVCAIVAGRVAAGPLPRRPGRPGHRRHNHGIGPAAARALAAQGAPVLLAYLRLEIDGATARRPPTASSTMTSGEAADAALRAYDYLLTVAAP
jgi:hypothetical protein